MRRSSNVSFITFCILFFVTATVFLPMITAAFSQAIGATPVGGTVVAVDPNTVFGSAATPYVHAVIGAAITGIFGFVAFILKSKFNVEIDEKYRLALEAYAKRQAAALVAEGAVRVINSKIVVDSPNLRAAARTAVEAIPQTMRWFGLTPDNVAERIIAAIPHVPVVAVHAESLIAPPTEPVPVPRPSASGPV